MDEGQSTSAHQDVHAIVARLRDDALAERVACDCHAVGHDDRWCTTCEARLDWIEDYRRAVLRGMSTPFPADLHPQPMVESDLSRLPPPSEFDVLTGKPFEADFDDACARKIDG